MADLKQGKLTITILQCFLKLCLVKQVLFNVR